VDLPPEGNEEKQSDLLGKNIRLLSLSTADRFGDALLNYLRGDLG